MSKWKYRFYAEVGGSRSGCKEKVVDLVDDCGENAADLEAMDERTLRECVNAHWEEWFWTVVNGGYIREGA